MYKISRSQPLKMKEGEETLTQRHSTIPQKKIMLKETAVETSNFTDV
jgi:hypothetical protein